MVLTHVMNTVTSAVTTFDGYAFNSFAEIGGLYYGANAAGVHQLDVGGTDIVGATPGAPINAQMTTGLIDFKSRVQKRVEDFYIAMRAEGDITLNVYVDEVLVGTYVLSPNDVETLKQVRTLIGKGARGRYWQFELITSDDFDFDAYNVFVVPTSRNI